MPEYASLSNRQQVEQIRSYAKKLIENYELKDPQLRLINHGFNTTFEVTTFDGNRYALRINVNSLREVKEIQAEIEWVQQIVSEGELAVPEPIPGKDGALIYECEWVGASRPLRCVLYAWLEGRRVGNVITPSICGKLGEAMRLLHVSGANVHFTKQAQFSQIDSLYGKEGYRLDEIKAQVDWQVFQQCENLATDAYKRLEKLPIQPIHFDLHFWNIFVRRGCVAVFDFDDAILGPTALDPAQTLFYLRKSIEYDACDEQFWLGLGKSTSELGISDEDLEALIAGRSLLLSNSMLHNMTAEIRDMLPKYLPAAERRLKHYLNTGRFVRLPMQ